MWSSAKRASRPSGIRDLQIMKWYVHVNQHIIRKNINAETKEPPVTIRRGRSGTSVRCFSADLGAGSRVIYSPDNPILSCGARLVIECPEEPIIVS
jgi:hypothetical protein